MRRWAIVLAAAAALAGGTAWAEAPAEPLPTVTARIESGPIIGVEHEHANVFRDIPYAAPPVGPLRWKPPRPVEKPRPKRVRPSQRALTSVRPAVNPFRSWA